MDVENGRPGDHHMSGHSRILLGLVGVYILACVAVPAALIPTSIVTIDFIMLIPVALAFLMYFWLCWLSWHHGSKYNTVSAASAAQNENFLRIILVVLTCLLGTSLAAILIDEYESRNRNPDSDNFLVCEIVFVLLLPLTGIFPTCEIPTDFKALRSWEMINLGTREHAVYIHGLLSFALHFIGVIPFMVGIPIINVVYAFNRPTAWVYVLAWVTICCLIFFFVLQVLIALAQRPESKLRSHKSSLFIMSYIAELLLVLLASISTILFSFKRNDRDVFNSFG